MSVTYSPELTRAMKDHNRTAQFREDGMTYELNAYRVKCYFPRMSEEDLAFNFPVLKPRNAPYTCKELCRIREPAFKGAWRDEGYIYLLKAK